MIQEAIAKAVAGGDLSEAEMEAAMSEVMGGQATPAQIAALLVGLRIKGETVEEITAAARAMRAACRGVECRVDRQGGCLVDTCGTGGDRKHTFNVSTTSAFVVAGAGAVVAKHGNRAVSSRSGSADLMEALGVSLDLGPEEMGQCLDEVGIAFLFAQALHPAMRHAAGPRRELGLRTVFNVLGPLTNPAGARAQVLGVFDPGLVLPMAQVLGRLGSKRAFVVHGEGGYDEITITGPTRMAILRDGKVEETVLTPEDLGLKRARPEEIEARTPEEAVAMARGVLEGEAGAPRDMVLINAAPALVAAGLAAGLAEGLAMAARSIDEGLALAKVRDLVRLSQKLAPPRAAA